MIKPSVGYIDYSHLYFRKRTGVVWGSFEVQWMYWEGFGCFGYDACQKKRFRVRSGSGSGYVSHGAEVMGVSHMIQHHVEGMAH